MKILIVSQRYWPETFRITDMAETLVQKARHQVTMLTGLPMYPGGYIYKGYKNRKNIVEEHNGIKIMRAKEFQRKNSVLNRFLNYYSFPFYAKKMIKKIDKDFDVVLINELSPILSALPALKYKKMYGVKVLMYEMDLWPESLLAGGIKKDSLIYRYYKSVSAKIYSKCDKILVSTKEHIDYIKSLPKCMNLDIDYLPQYAESIFEKTQPAMKESQNINLMFAGNVGKAQSINTIIEAASLVKDNPIFKFHIIGGGSELENIKKMVMQSQLNNVVFYGQLPLDKMPEMYSKADVMLVTLKNQSYANMTIPGKIQSYMSYGKPIIGAVNGSCANFIKQNNLGYVCDAEDYEGLANIIKKLNKTNLVDIGNHSRKVYFENYSKTVFIRKMLSALEAISKNSSLNKTTKE